MDIPLTSKISARTQVVGSANAKIGDYVLITVPRLQLGNGSQIGAGTKIIGRGPVVLGAHVVIGYNCIIMSSSDRLAKSMDDASPEFERNIITAPIILEDYVYVGSGSVIMPGVTIRRRGVLGALSYLSHNQEIPAGKLAWGIPAKIMGDR